MVKDHLDEIAADFVSQRDRLAALAARRLNDVLAQRFSVDDVLQETFLAASRRQKFFADRPDVPIYFKFRTILLQVIAEFERENLNVQKRDAGKEISLSDMQDNEAGSARDLLADTAPSPATRLAKNDRFALLKHVLQTLPENDRQILTLRHFDGFSNSECAEVLAIEQKAASIRYARALVRLRERLADFSEFQK